MSGSPYCKKMWRQQQGKSLLLYLGEQRDNIVMKHLSFHCVSAHFMDQHLFCFWVEVRGSSTELWCHCFKFQRDKYINALNKYLNLFQFPADSGCYWFSSILPQIHDLLRVYRRVTWHSKILCWKEYKQYQNLIISYALRKTSLFQ